MSGPDVVLSFCNEVRGEVGLPPEKHLGNGRAFGSVLLDTLNPGLAYPDRFEQQGERVLFHDALAAPGDLMPQRSWSIPDGVQRYLENQNER